MSRLVLRAGVAVAALAAAVLVPATAAHAATSKNLIKNGGGEAAAGSNDGGVVAVPRWTVPAGSQFTAVQYGASGGFPAPSDPGPANRGANFFAGGSPTDNVSTATQSISLRDYLAAINAGTAQFKLSGYLGGYSGQEDNAIVSVSWQNGAGAELGTASIGPVTATDRSQTTGLLRRTKTGTVPVGTRKAVVTVTITRTAGSYDDGYADNLALTITT